MLKTSNYGLVRRGAVWKGLVRTGEDGYGLVWKKGS